MSAIPSVSVGVADEEDKTSYTPYHKKYYEKHREAISQRAKERAYWKTYYERHKDEIRVKARERYRQKLAADATAKGSTEGAAAAAGAGVAQ